MLVVVLLIVGVLVYSLYTSTGRAINGAKRRR
jgi:hypothetical protein